MYDNWMDLPYLNVTINAHINTQRHNQQHIGQLNHAKNAQPAMIWQYPQQRVISS